MNTFELIWNKIKGSPSVLFPTFQISPDHILDEPQPEKTPFVANHSYFEIRIKEQFLKNRREYWNEYIPLTLVFSEFIYANNKESFPFVVGPDMLKKIQQLEGNENVRYKNTRVVGPTPYRGDQVALFTGLFRLKTMDWALQAINLLETVANAFDTSKLTSYLNIATPLMKGIEGFFGMDKQMDFRIGQRFEYTDPETGTPGFFSPGYWVMIRKDANLINKNTLWVQDGQLFTGSSKNDLKPYLESDYIIYSIDKLAKRNDYLTFGFHNNWADVKKAIWDGNNEAAASAYQLLIANLRQSHDIIDSQMNQLQALYLAQFHAEVKAYNDSVIKPATIKNNTVLGMEKTIFANLEFEEEGKNALLATDRLLSHISGSLPPDSGSEIDEKYIQWALDSELLRDKAIVGVDPSFFANLISTMMFYSPTKG